MKLFEGKIHKTYRVKNKDLPIKIDRRLEALGMTVGTSVDVLHKKKYGALVIKVRGTRLAVGKHISENIQVEEEESHE